MFERMLNKDEKPTIEQMISYCGEKGKDFSKLNEWLADKGETEQQFSFPYGNHYGWAITHRKKKKLMCHVFPENGAFTVMLRLSDKQIETVYDKVQKDTKHSLDNKYPCNDGGWIHYRVTNKEQLEDIQTLLAVKCGM